MEIIKEQNYIYISKDGTEFENKEECLEYESKLVSLAEETLNELKNNGKNIKDVLGVLIRPLTHYLEGFETQTFKTTFENFLEVTKDYYYDNSYGGDCPILGWLIVGDNWFIERMEYDGSSWWEFKEIPNLENLETKTITKKDIE